MAAPTATPPSVMLAIDGKITTTTDLYAPLHAYATKAYSSSLSSIDNDLKSISNMRSTLQSQTPSSSSHISLLLSYYRALLALLPRFPVSPDRSHVSTLAFTWHDAFKPSKKASQRNLHFEMAAVMFNVGAVHSQLALGEDRGEVAGLRAACAGFQSAAGAFRYLRNRVAVNAGLGGGVTVDVTVECAGMLERLMLAQAQECFFEKAVADAKPPGLCSKIAQQVAIFYKEAFQALNGPPLNQHFDRTWICHLQLKAAHFFAEACYRIGLDLHEKEDVAEEIARLKSGISILADAKKSTRGVSPLLLDAVAKLETNMNRNLERAVKENERVYLMRVPEIGSLAPVPAASLVKPTDLGEILDISAEYLFANIVPESSTKDLSSYTEMVDDIIRIQAEKLQQASEISRVKLKEMTLPDSILSLDRNFEMPLDLKRDVEALQIVGGPSGFEAELQQLRDLRRVDQELLKEAEELLQKEEREDTHFRVQYGTRWVRPQSTTLTKNLHDRLKTFAANFSQAVDSDARIECSVKENSDIMSILDYKPIESALQSRARPPMSLDGNIAIVGALKQSLGQLEALGAKGAHLQDMLKEIKGKDDILPKLMATSGSYEDLYQKEISKYDRTCEDISENVKAQENLLLQIQAQKDEFLASSKVEDYKALLGKSYEQVATAVAKFKEIKENINEGLSFYVTIQDAINDIKQLCGDFVMCRNMESQGMIEDVQRTISGLHAFPDER